MTKDRLPTRDRIIRAAEPLFAQHGFAGVSMRAIATAAGVKLGGLPYHFGTKDALYRSIWEEWRETLEIRDLLDDLDLHPTKDDRERLRAIVGAFFAGPGRLLAEERGRHFVRIMVREAHDPGNRTRTLIEDFIYPNGMAVREHLARLFPSMPTDAREVAFEMMVSALRIVIEDDQTADGNVLDQALAERKLALLTEFVVSGWWTLNTQVE